jgi:type I restriction enzyme S subunit
VETERQEMTRWPSKSLGELVDFIGGGTPSRDRPDYWNGDIPWASVKDLQSQSLETTLESITADGLANSASNLIPPGTVIIASRVGLGKVAINRKPVAINQDLKALTLRNYNLLPRYLLLFLLSKADYFERAGVGATVKGLTIADYQKLNIVLPTLAEQERIVRLLDEADELRRLRAQADRRTADLIPALFHEMFGDPRGSSKGFRIEKLGTVTAFITSGSRGWARYYSERGARFIRVQNLESHHLSFVDVAHVNPPDTAETLRTRVQSNDLLLAITGNTIGLSALVPEDVGEAYVSQHVAIIRLSQLVVSSYIASFMALPAGGQYQIAQMQYGHTKPGISLQQIRDMNILLPPLSLQKEFAARVSDIRAMQAEQATSRRRLDDLFQSMLHRAFNGEL